MIKNKLTTIALISILTFLISCNSSTQSSENEVKSIIKADSTTVDAEGAKDLVVSDSTVESKASGFVENLKTGEKLSAFFKDNWLFVYHEDNRCDGSTDGKLDKLKSSLIDSVISLEVKTNGEGWDCDKKEPKTFVLDFDLRKKIMDWDRFEIPNYDDQEENVVYVQGAGESGYIILQYDDKGLIVRLEYRSEDPG